MADVGRADSPSVAAGGLPGARFLEPRLLARIDNLELLARHVVEGFISGLHRSPHLGFSTDFAEHRQYMPGDDIRHIDWRLFARTDRFYLKEYEADTNTNFVVLLDVSGSMAYRSAPDGVTKLEYAKFIGACLTYLAHRQRDRVGLVSFADDVREYVPPSARRHLQNALHAMDRAQADGKSDLVRVARQVADQRRRGLVLLLSDFYEATDTLPPSRLFAMPGMIVLAMQIWIPPNSNFRSKNRPRSRTWKPGIGCQWYRAACARNTPTSCANTLRTWKRSW
ncbi:MAG: DUF58 domain-containing protein [Gemmatimonadaceae bacterium]